MFAALTGRDSAKNLILHVPLPLCGVALAIASLGGLLKVLWTPAYPICGVTSFLLLLLVVCKGILNPKGIRADLENPVLAGVAGTFSMCVLVLSTYVAPYFHGLGFGIWVFGVAAHLCLIANLIAGAFRKGWQDFLLPSCFVTLIGLVLACLTASSYPVGGFLVVLFWIELAVTFILLSIVTVRYMRAPVGQEAQRPLLAIYAAPTNMCLACYLALYPAPSGAFLDVLMVLSAACYVFAFASMLRCLPLRFYPSYAALTFPFVISTSATTMLASSAVALGMGAWVSALQCVAGIQLAIATCITIYVLVRYLAFLVPLAKNA